jgi:anti-sigma regulatory factor (Ser/Thr protein kinase)
MAGPPTSTAAQVDLAIRHARRFPCAPASGAATRAFVRTVWPDAGDDVVLAASELAANAIEHAGTEFEVCIALGPDAASVSVRDWAPQSWPRARPGTDLGERGRGLGLVASLSHRWGWTVAGGSKVVWFQV